MLVHKYWAQWNLDGEAASMSENKLVTVTLTLLAHDLRGLCYILYIYYILNILYIIYYMYISYIIYIVYIIYIYIYILYLIYNKNGNDPKRHGHQSSEMTRAQ